MHTDAKDHLYCLALSRRNHDGSLITPADRNTYKFHFRHFVSENRGVSWRDKGSVLNPHNISDENDAGNVWSGGVLPLDDGRILHGLTGISDTSDEHPFVQSVNFAIGSSDGPVEFSRSAASHPIRDREHIVALGYYLPSIEQIGHKNGEDGGPITAWRDPFFFRDEDGEIFAFWSAKIGPRRPAVAWGKVLIEEDTIRLQLLPPIKLPDDSEYTQAEVPKICQHLDTELYYMMVSSCDRISEAQHDSEVSKHLRLYKSESLEGPWLSCGAVTSVLENTEFLFGASFLDMHPTGSSLKFIAPYTEKASEKLQLTFAPVQSIQI